LAWLYQEAEKGKLAREGTLRVFGCNPLISEMRHYGDGVGLTPDQEFVWAQFPPDLKAEGSLPTVESVLASPNGGKTEVNGMEKPIKIIALPNDAVARHYIVVENVEELERLAAVWNEPIFDAGIYCILFHDGRVFAAQTPP